MRIFRKLAQLLDVDLTSTAPEDGDALTYDAGSEKWVPGAGGGGGGAPTDATYITQTANGDLENEQALSALATGLVKVTNGTGVLSAAVGGTDYANASHQHAGEDITSGTVADARIASTIARDSEVTSAISALSSVYQAKDTTLDTYAGIDPSANVQSVLGAADYAAIRTLLSLVVGTDIIAKTTFDDHSARHEDGGADEISIAGLSGTSAALQAHLDDTADAHDASAISVLDTNGDYTATDVEGVLAEIAPQLGGSDWTYVIKAATESVSSSTTVQDDDELFFSTTAGVLYEVTLQIFYDSPAGGATPDFKIVIGEDTTVRGSLSGIGVTTSDANAAAQLAANLTNTLSVGTNAAERALTLIGYHRGNGGTWKVMWAQNTSNGNATRVLAGSFVKYRAVN